jgi:dTDP-4-dehydrorhamnose reductase
MKVLVLGASGFLGGKVYRNLKDKYEVLGTYFSSKENDELARIDINNYNDVRKVFEEFKPDIVIWCLLNMNNEKKLTEIGLSNVIKSLDYSSKLIYISTDGFYGGNGDYREDVELKHYSVENPLSAYVNAKIDGEKAVISHKNHAIVRTGPLYGQDINNNWDKRITDLINTLSQNKKIYRSSNLYKTFVQVDDLANLIGEIVEKDYKGIIHVGPGEKESYFTFNRKIARKLNLNEELILEDIIEQEQSNLKGIPLDTSMNTEKCRRLFSTKFRSV